MTTPTIADLIARATETTSTSTATSTSKPSADERPAAYHVVGIILAISSGLFIGVSFVIKKVGLLKANKKYNEEAGEGYGYLKNAWWWLGMSLMIVGEICNFVAYAFVDAILVTPMGSLSVVVTTILSAIFLKERLSFVGKVGCFNCIIGSIVIVVNAPAESAVATIQEMQHFVIAPGFLTYAGVILVGCTIIALWAGPKYGKKSMLVYLSVCSLIGGLSVVATQGLGAAIIAQIGGKSQFNQWFLYVLFVFVIGTLLTEIVYLNKALNIFNAALVTPTYYVFFTSATIVTSAILFRGFKGTPLQIVTIVMGFLQICAGVVLLQLSKSAKDVPDTAVFKGDLDQVRTMGEQEEHESEPKADAIRGGAALLRTISKARLRKEADEAKRIQAEHLEPIGEDEHVEWDGLRRRKTTLTPGQPTLRRQKTVHPPLGMAHFPRDDNSNEESHNPEDDIGLFPNFRRRTRTILHRKSDSRGSTSRPGTARLNSTTSSTIDPKSDGGKTHTVALTTIPSATSYNHPTTTNDDIDGDLSAQHHRPQTYHLPDALRRNTSIGLSGLTSQDTSYRSPGVHGSTVTWDPSVSISQNHLSPSSTPGPAPPPHRQPSQVPAGGKRQFSFQHVFGGSRSGPSSSPERPISAKSTSTGGTATSFSRRVFSGFGRQGSSGQGQQRTEEERLGLVTGDSVEQRGGGSGVGGGRRRRATDGMDDGEGDGYGDGDEVVEGYSDDEEDDGRRMGTLGHRKSRGRRREEELRLGRGYDDAAFDESPERISSEEGPYARVRRRSNDDDLLDGRGGKPAGGFAFV